MKIVLLAALAVALSCSPGPVAQAADATPEVYVVFFPFNGAAISPIARRVLDRVIVDFRRTRANAIGVRGYTDLAGPTAYNLKLSAGRANAVKAYLVAHGVKGGALRVEWFGKTHPRVATANGVRNDQNRRTELVLQP
jgi:OmpA-OmpF porin, OOP family